MAMPAQQLLAYEVATIKPWDGKGFAMPLRVYIQVAFGMPPNTIGSVIGSDWINGTRYVIQVNIATVTKIDYRAVGEKSRCAGMNRGICLIFNELCWSGRSDSN